MADDLVKRLREVTGFIRVETGCRVAAAASISEEAADRIEKLEAEIENLRTSVIAFAGPHAAKWARDCGLPAGHLHPTHYDILRSAGARMDDFTRAQIDPKGGA